MDFYPDKAQQTKKGNPIISSEIKAKTINVTVLQLFHKKSPGGHLNILYTGVHPIIMGEIFTCDLILFGTCLNILGVIYRKVFTRES